MITLAGPAKGLHSSELLENVRAHVAAEAWLLLIDRPRLSPRKRIN
jgi:hypothetical protein